MDAVGDLALADHEEADAALSLLRDRVAGREFAFLERLRNPVQVPVGEARKQRDPAQELGGSGHCARAYPAGRVASTRFASSSIFP